MTAVALEAVFLLTTVLLVVPFVGWLEDAIRARTSPVGIGGGSGGFLRPIATALSRLSTEAPGERVGGQSLAVWLALVLPLLALVGAPLAGRHAFGDVGFSGVVADIEWGVPFALALLVASAWVPLGVAREPEALAAALRSSVQSLAAMLPLVLACCGLFIVFGSLRLSEIVIAQDQGFRLLAVAEAGGWEGAPAWLDAVRLPAWGIVVQPLAFAIFVPSALAVARCAPFDPEPSLDGWTQRAQGVRLGGLEISRQLQTLVVASLVVGLFLGGWSIPWLPQQTLVAAIASFYGEAVAGLLAVGLQVAVFLAKWIAVTALLVVLRGAVPRSSPDQLEALCWKLLVPLALLNVFATAGVWLWVDALDRVAPA